MLKNLQPRYLQVKNKIIGEIISGNYPDGTFLPPEKTLMEQFNVARNTVRTALKELEKEQIILKQQGRPSIIQRKYIDIKPEAKPLKIAWLDTSPCRIGASGTFRDFPEYRYPCIAKKTFNLIISHYPMLSKEDLSELDFSAYAGVITNGVSPEPDIVQLLKKNTRFDLYRPYDQYSCP